MRTQTTLLLAAASLPLLASACGGSINSPQKISCTSAPVTTAMQPIACMGANAIATEANDYAFTSTITLPPVTVKSMTNLKFDWSAVTHDFTGHPLDPVVDLDTVSLLLWKLPLTDLEVNLNADTLFQTDLEVVPPPSWPDRGGPTGGATSAQLYDFTVNGEIITAEMYNMYLDPMVLPTSYYTYMIA